MCKELKISLPLYVHTTKSNTQKGKFILNLNNYRNCHFIKLNKAKTEYARIVKEIVKDFEKMETAELEYKYFAKTKGKIDVSNPCSIIDKFTCDALTEIGLWEDDDIKTVKSVKYIWGGVDKDNPRCELKCKNTSKIT